MLSVALICTLAFAQSPETVQVMVAAHDIPAGKMLYVEDLAMTELPPDYVPDAVFRQPEQVVGRIVRETILSQEFIREERLADPESGRNIGVLVPPGSRLVHLPLKKPTNWPQPTDRLDIAYFRDAELCVAVQAALVLYTESRPDRFLSFGAADQMATSVLVAVPAFDVGLLLGEEDPILMLRGPADHDLRAVLPMCEVR